MITYHPEVTQGSDEWLAMRRGILTASEMNRIITPTLKIAGNDKSRAHELEIAAQRISGYVEPHYVGDDMLRGMEDEFYARQLYADHYAPVTETGFITNDKLGFLVGYSPDGLVGDDMLRGMEDEFYARQLYADHYAPVTETGFITNDKLGFLAGYSADGLVGDDGLIEVKSRRQRFQIETIASCEVPAEYMIQLQTGLLVTERQWIDFISYSGGLPMFVQRVEPDPEIQEAIIAAARAFEVRVEEKMLEYRASVVSRKLIPTERRVEQEMFV